MKFAKLQLIREERPRGAGENMAVDEALLLTAECPVLRSYGWIRPSVSYGYFTPWKTVVDRYADRELVRRWTGGGIVEHGEDFTYSLVLPAGESLPANVELYRFIHLAISRLLRDIGYPVEIAQFPDAVRSNACFEKAVEFDLKYNGEKIAGAAIRRNRKGLLLQGSIQRLQVSEYFVAMLADALGAQIEIFTPSDLTMERAARIGKEKYGAAEWNRRF